MTTTTATTTMMTTTATTTTMTTTATTTMTGTTTRTMTDSEPQAGGHPRRRVPARIRIIGWVMLLMLGVLVVVNVATRQELYRQVDTVVDEALVQEVEELVGVASGGVNRSTDRPYTSVAEILDSHLQRQFPDDDEVVVGVLADGAVIRQDRGEPYPFASRPERARQVAADPDSTGSLHTEDGELRWRKVVVDPPSGNGEPGTFIVGVAVDRDRDEVASTMRTLTLVSLVGLLLAGIGAYLVSGRILAPIRLVRDAAAEINEKDLTRRIEVRGRDDVSALAEQFNAMLDRLSDAFGAQREFIDDASHELRTPITIVRGHLELMGDDPDERKAVMRLVTEELDRMSRIVEDLLLLAKSERPDFVRPRSVSVAELTVDIHSKVRALGDRRWLLDSVGEGTAFVDPQRITQAMVALAHNAVGHTSDGEEIRIGSSLHEVRGVPVVAFWVTDTGPGISENDQDKIFERFHRGRRSGEGARAGAGLGLAIVRAIAQAHHGQVTLRSAPGQGSTFGVEAPAGAESERISS
ncbi:HAMP domain-containing histidine kinase [Gordonia sp. HY002]|uniref:sensor histidine kinase n=2 Tax=Gordonia zhenghanii TaxID=2911516 RepID=UPI001F27463E|nr:HAMP domain-containing sensor histidine kinase [Gordonia zhenghanii]MCF8572302.1 HAMP domain-containing histidine kinase [Gordonia zhenghanii]